MESELKTLQTLRQRTLDEAESGLGAARDERERREADHVQARDRLASASSAVRVRVERQRQQQARAIRGGQWVNERRYQERLIDARDRAVEAVRRAAARVTQAEAAEEAARQVLLEAKRQLQVLDKHLERQTARQRQEELRRADKEQDDLVNARHPPK